MKNFVTLLLALALLFVISACGSGSSDEESSEGISEGASEETNKDSEAVEITLTYSDNEAPGSMRTQFLEDVWFTEIENQTDNKVTVDPTYGGALFTGAEVLEGIESGIVDMGVVFPGHTTEKLYSYELFKLFYEAPTSWEALSEVYDNAFGQLPLFDEQLESFNQKRLLVTAGLPMVFGANYEMDSLYDLEGHDWRAASPWHLQSLEDLGANPVSVPWSDVYTSLSTGVIDGVYTNFDSYHAEKMYEQSKTVLVTPQLWTGTPFIHTINLDTWNSLPEDVQEGIMKATEIAQEKFEEIYDGTLESFVEEERSEGYNVVVTESQDVQPFINNELLDSMRDSWIQDADSKHGFEEGEEYINKMNEILENAVEKDQ